MPTPWWKTATVYQIYPRSFASGKSPNGTLVDTNHR